MAICLASKSPTRHLAQTVNESVCTQTPETHSREPMPPFDTENEISLEKQ